MKRYLLEALRRFPRLKNFMRGLRDRMMPDASVSNRYVLLQDNEAGSEGRRLRGAWKDEDLPRRQRELVERQLQQFKVGGSIDVFDVLVEAVKALPEVRSGMSILEVGCSSGFYSEVLDTADLQLKYSGCDYSPAFIDLARESYPGLDFAVEDATALHYPDRSFDIVVSGCCLLHIPEYVSAVAETSRVSARYAIFHRTPVVWGEPERWYRKSAYGVETVEIHFNEPSFLAMLEQYGFELIATHTLHEEFNADNLSQGSAVRTYVCRKKSL